ncbi:hypothetical protein [Cellulomonas sp. HZM]|uniref:hypothetical protein n=1 Tax=Cellulomonas sp. HZM TaxID=1454010 RepID=UPI00049396A0|nr:hypothetical protein [Cellulomonas sp. HZM]
MTVPREPLDRFGVNVGVNVGVVVGTAPAGAAVTVAALVGDPVPALAPGATPEQPATSAAAANPVDAAATVALPTLVLMSIPSSSVAPPAGTR